MVKQEHSESLFITLKKVTLPLSLSLCCAYLLLVFGLVTYCCLQLLIIDPTETPAENPITQHTSQV